MFKKIAACITALLVLQFAYAQQPPFYDEIQSFKRNDSLFKPLPHAILFVGSSSFNYWMCHDSCSKSCFLFGNIYLKQERKLESSAEDGKNYFAFKIEVSFFENILVTDILTISLNSPDNF